jgi:hypothetical protein
MAPYDRLHLPFRWEFSPVRHEADGSIRWQWKAYTQSGKVALQSDRTFEALTDCMDDARKEGYGES